MFWRILEIFCAVPRGSHRDAARLLRRTLNVSRIALPARATRPHDELHAPPLASCVLEGLLPLSILPPPQTCTHTRPTPPLPSEIGHGYLRGRKSARVVVQRREGESPGQDHGHGCHDRGRPKSERREQSNVVSRGITGVWGVGSLLQIDIRVPWVRQGHWSPGAQ